ncbi:MAG: transglutaminase-like cysteine peptidase [Geminicoccaceae bacterium]
MNKTCTRRNWLLGAAALLVGPSALPGSARADGPTYWQARLSGWQGHDTSLYELAEVSAHGLRSLIDEARSLPRGDAVYLVNRMVNSLPFSPEPAGFDRWQSPIATWRQGGDCEDLALLKAAILAEVGFAPEDLRLVVADVPYWGLHAFLTVRAESRWWRLDNLAEACGWDGGAIAYPGPAHERLWLSPPIETAANSHRHGKVS